MLGSRAWEVMAVQQMGKEGTAGGDRVWEVLVFPWPPEKLAE